MTTQPQPTSEKAAPCNWGREAVQSFASKLAEELAYTPGGDIEAVVRSLGGRITKTDWQSTNHTGSIRVRGASDFDIFLSPMAGVGRNRFTIAHELGHYILHSQAGKKPIFIRRDGAGLVEWEANWFAAGFLMPEAAFRAKVKERWGNAELAEHFGVSKAAVEIRRQALGL